MSSLRLPPSSCLRFVILVFRSVSPDVSLRASLVLGTWGRSARCEVYSRA